nr:hypothetical protein [Tanacetum cinerariifolium]
MEEHEEGFVDVKRHNKRKDISHAWGSTRLPKPKNFQWQQKKRVSSKEGSNGASSSDTTNKGDVPSIHYAKQDLNTSNSFEVLNVVEEDAKVSEQNSNGSQQTQKNRKAPSHDQEDDSKVDEEYDEYTNLCDNYDIRLNKDTHELLRKLIEDLQITSEELAEYINSPSWNRLAFYDNDDEHSIQYKEYLENSSNAITPVLPTEEPDNSLSMRDDHFSTILETESDEVIKSSVEILVSIPSESEVTSDNESECDVPVCDDFTIFSNPIFNSDDFSFNDDESLSNEDVPIENFKIYSNPLLDDEEIISSKIDPHHFAEFDLIESLLNRNTLINSSPKFDYLLEEFFGELAHIDPIPSGIKEADFDLEEEIRLVENLLYDNSSPRPPEELNTKIANTIVESLSPSPISVKDNDS